MRPKSIYLTEDQFQPDDGVEIFGSLSLYAEPEVDLYASLPLKHSDSIRLLRIEPGRGDDELKCKLYVVRLSEIRGLYWAMSYIWGSCQNLRPVTINHSSVLVRSNLFEFLRRLRHKKRYVVVWADAICIDQEKDREKNHQVQLMSKIYSQAKCTCLWLGTEMIARTARLQCATVKPNVLNKFSFSMEDKWYEQDFITSLLNNDYWTRTWVLQEVILARKVYVYCGKDCFRWDELVNLCNGIIYGGTGFDLIDRYEQSILLRMDKHRGSTRTKDLPELLQTYSGTSCTDIRDRIFGLIGLISDHRDPLFEKVSSEQPSEERVQVIDYTAPPSILFTRLLQLYGVRPAASLAIPFWRALNLQHADMEMLKSTRIRVQIFPWKASTDPYAPQPSDSHSIMFDGSPFITAWFRFCLIGPTYHDFSDGARLLLSKQHNIAEPYGPNGQIINGCEIQAYKEKKFNLAEAEKCCQAFSGTRVLRDSTLKSGWCAEISGHAISTLLRLREDSASLYKRVSVSYLQDFQCRKAHMLNQFSRAMSPMEFS